MKKKVSPTMKKLQKFTKQLHKWRDRLWLGKWRFQVDHYSSPTDDEKKIAARVSPQGKYYQANFKVTDLLFEQTKDDQDRIALHEVCHLLLADMCSFMQDLIEEMPSDQQDFMFKRWQEVHENTTSSLETIFWFRPRK